MAGSNSALSRVTQQAEAAAEAFQAPAGSNQLVPVQQQSTALTTTGNRPTLDSIADSSGIQVDEYLTIKDTGFRIGDNKAPLFNEAIVEIDMSEVQPILSVRYTRAGNTNYIKSYDGGITTATGQNFQNELARVQATSEKVDGPYPTMEIPMELLEDVGGAKAGTRIGATPPVTGVKFFTKFYNQLRQRGLQEAAVKVKVTHTPQSNRNGNEWGVASFELIED